VLISGRSIQTKGYRPRQRAPTRPVAAAVKAVFLQVGQAYVIGCHAGLCVIVARARAQVFLYCL
jgi:hypothetical protein